MGASSGAHAHHHRGGAGGGSSGQAPPPVTQWTAFKRALASDQHFDHCYWISVGLSAAFDCLMRMLGPCLVVLAVLLIGSVAFLYFGYLLPLLVARDAAGGRLQSSSLRFLHGAWATFLLFNVLFNYAACVLTPPGGLEQEQPRQGQCRGQGQESAAAAAAVYEHEEEGVSYALGASAANGGAGMGQQHHGSSCIAGGVDPRTYGFCKKCRFPRPPRAHHCHVCRRCVLKMDHHCPWINNCVGQNNYRPFVLFLVYMWSACVYGVLLLWRPFLALVYGGNGGPQMPAIVGSLASERSAVVFVFVLSLSVGAALTGLLGWHVHLISTGQTTIEFYVNKARREKARLRGVLYANPYDLGSCGRNWGQVFGDLPWWRAALPSTRPPPPQLRRRPAPFEGARDDEDDEEAEGDDGWRGSGNGGPFASVSEERDRLLLRVV